MASPFDPTVVLLAFSGVIFVGFLGLLLFERTRVPDIVWLIALGLFLGPVNAAYLHLPVVSDLLTPARIDLLTPALATAALLVILFEGGLNIRLQALRAVAAATAFHTTVIFVLSTILTYVAARFLFGYPEPVALLAAIILAGTSGAVVTSMTRRMRLTTEVRTVLVLEAILTTVVATALVLAILMNLERGTGIDAAFVASSVGLSLGIAVAVGLPVGIAWLFALQRVQKVPFAFMTTLASAFSLGAVLDAVGGNGPLAVLIFGIVLGNGELVGARLRRSLSFPEDQNFRRFMAETSFLFSAFFFVLLGLLFRFDPVSSANLRTSIPGLAALDGTVGLFTLGMAAFLGVFAVGRLAVVPVTARMLRIPREQRLPMWALLPRGKVTVVLSLLPFSRAAFSDPTSAYYAVLAPYRDAFINTALVTVLATVLVAAVGTALYERRVGPRTSQPVPAPVSAPSPPPPEDEETAIVEP